MRGGKAVEEPVERLTELLREYRRSGSEEVRYRASQLGRELHGLMMPPDRILGFFLEALKQITPVTSEFEDLLLEVMITYSSSFLMAEEELRRSEERFRGVYEGAPIGIVLISRSGQLVKANPALCQMLGYTEEELTALSFRDLARRIDASMPLETEELFRAEMPIHRVDGTFMRRDWEMLWVQLTTATLYGEDGLPLHGLVMVEDITERKQLEEELLTSERLSYQRRLLALHRHAAELAEAGSMPMVCKSTLDAMEDALGFQYVAFLIVEEGRLSTLATRGAPILDLELPLEGRGITVRAAKTRRSVLVNDLRRDPEFVKGFSDSLSELAVPVLVEDECIAVLNAESLELDAFTMEDQVLVETLAQHTASGITRLRQREALQKSEERFRGIVERSYDGIVNIDLEGRVTYTSPSVERITGHKTEEFMGRLFQEVLLASEAPRLLHALAEARRGEISEAFEVEILRRDSSRAYLELNVSPILREGDIVGFQVIAGDITRRRQAEDQVRDLVYGLNGVSPGRCYLYKSHFDAFKVYADLTLHGVKSLCLLREDPEALISGYGVAPEGILLLSSRSIGGFKAVSDLQEVSRVISGFLEGRGLKVVLLDGLEYLIARSGFEAVYHFIQEKRFGFLEAKAVLLIPIDPGTLSERENALLASELEIKG